VRLSISKAWEETSAFVSRETRLLVPIALALLFLPGVLAGLAAPMKRSDVPSGGFLLLLCAELLIGVIGQIAIARLALGHREPVGEAIRHAAIRLPALIGSVFLIAVPLTFVILIVGGGAAAMAKAGGGNPVLAILVTLLLAVLIVATLILALRCLLNTAIAAVETGGPVRLLKRGFALTRGHVLKLLGAALLLAIGGGVAIVALTSITGLGVRLALGDPEPWTVAALLLAVVGAAAQAVFSVLFTVFFARVYAQLAAGETSVPSSAI
jgi:hypothetical protein